MAKVAQSLPHYGIKNGFSRKGAAVCIKPERKIEGVSVPAEFKNFASVSKAKRFMRTGESA